MGRTRDTSKIFTITTNNYATTAQLSASVASIDVTDELNATVFVGSASPSSSTKIWIDTSTASAPVIRTYSDNLWRGTRLSNLGGYFTASGGTVTTSGNYRIHTFTSSSNLVISDAYDNTPNAFNGIIEYLVVAGGGAGGTNGGGGGAGGARTGSVQMTSGIKTVTIGSGGVGGLYPTLGTNGGNSFFDTIESTGGGRGGSEGAGFPVGANGGSGGGGGYQNQPGGSGIAGQGNAGAASTGGTAGLYGGGGGATTTGSGQNGGTGIQSSINGTATYYAGGGGGGRQSGSPAGTGGLGGGGNGNIIESTASAGTVNTGGGGGGSAGGSGRSGNGGSGVVIIRYQVLS